MDVPLSPLPQPAAAPRGTNRRWFLAGAAAIVLGGGTGALLEVLRDDRTAAPAAPLPPAALVAAAAVERALIADLDATTGGTPAVRQVIVQARADHAAHLRALTALLGRFRAPATSAGASATSVRGTPRTVSELRAAERHAADAAAGRAARLPGNDAALLASIAACEATHAELFR